VFHIDNTNRIEPDGGTKLYMAWETWISKRFPGSLS